LVEETARIVLLAFGATGACSFLTAAQMDELDRMNGMGASALS
jgi:hypothetical protein